MKHPVIRLTALLSAVVLLTALLAACAPQTAAPAASSEAASSSAVESTEFVPQLDTEAAVNLDVSGFFGNFEALDQIINAFNEYYPNVTISYEQNSGAKLVEYMKNNPNVDIVMVDDTNLRYSDWTEYYVLDQLADLSAENVDVSALQDDLLPYCTHDGKLACVPISLNLSGLVVNETLLRKEGLEVPTNWQEFLDVCAALKEKGYTPIQGARTMVYSELVYNMAMAELGSDPTLVEALNNGEDAAVEAMEKVYSRLQTLLDEGYTDPELNAEYPDDNYDGAILRFFEGDVPFWVCNTEKFSGMKKRESKSETYSANPFDYEFVYAPLGDNGAYEYVEPWFGFAVNKNSDDYDYAIEFMRFLARSEQLDTMASVKGVPTASKSGVDERYPAIHNTEKVEKRFVNDGSVMNHMKDYFRNDANKLASGDMADAKAAAEDYVSRCAETAKEMTAAN